MWIGLDQFDRIVVANLLAPFLREAKIEALIPCHAVDRRCVLAGQ